MVRFFKMSRNICLLGLSSLLAPALSAQTPSIPNYQMLRYEEDWSILADPASRTDPWDPWKYISLGHSGWFLTLAGEARERYEVLNHPNFGSGPTDENGYLLQRYLFSGDFHFGPRLRIFAELQSGLEEGRNGGARLTDLDKLDIHQAFMDFGLIRRDQRKLTLRVGRQEIKFGSGRLISPGEGLNVRRSLDGARLTFEQGKWLWNATAMRIVGISPGFFNDVPDHTQSFWGLGVIAPHPFWHRANLTVYYLGTDRKNAVFNKGQGRSTRETLGSRSWTECGPWDLSYEGIFQWGTFRDAPIRAWALASETGYTFRSAGWTPRIGLHVDATSGDRGTKSLGSFDPLFPSSTAYPDPSGILGPTNLIVAEPTMKLQLTPKLALTLAAASFWRESTADGVYGIFLTPVRYAGTGEARHVATHVSTTLSWNATRHITAAIYGQHFFNGEFLKQSPPSRIVNFLNGTIAFRF